MLRKRVVVQLDERKPNNVIHFRVLSSRTVYYLLLVTSTNPGETVLLVITPPPWLLGIRLLLLSQAQVRQPDIEYQGHGILVLHCVVLNKSKCDVLFYSSTT